eukprot:UN19866
MIILVFYDTTLDTPIGSIHHSIFRGDYVLENEEDLNYNDLILNNLQICFEDPDSCIPEQNFIMKMLTLFIGFT